MRWISVISQIKTMYLCRQRFDTEKINHTNLREQLGLCEFSGLTTVCRIRTPILYKTKTESKE